jgi:hypothetical protein
LWDKFTPSNFDGTNTAIVFDSGVVAHKKLSKSITLTDNTATLIYTFTPDTATIANPYSPYSIHIKGVTGNIYTSIAFEYIVSVTEGASLVKAAIKEVALSDPADVNASARTISSVTPSVVINGGTVEVYLTVVSGGSAAPFDTISSIVAEVVTTSTASMFTIE